MPKRRGIVKHAWAAMLLALFTLPFACSQSAPTALPAWEVISVKLSKPDQPITSELYTLTGISIRNETLVGMMLLAYQLYGSGSDEISGLPDWAAKTHFDIEAKVADADTPRLKNLEPAERAQTLQALLAGRFDLVAHRVTHQGPVYALLAGKHGTKLKQAVTGDIAPNGLPRGDKRAGGTMSMGQGHLEVQGIGMAELARALTVELNRTVLDRTTLAGTYSFTLDWTTQQAEDAGVAKADAPPGLFTALEEQLGLRLEATRGPIAGVVVDKVMMPGAN